MRANLLRKSYSNNWYLSQEGVMLLRQAVQRKWYLVEKLLPECASLHIRFSRYGKLQHFRFRMVDNIGNSRYGDDWGIFNNVYYRVKRALVREIILSLPILKRVKDGNLCFDGGCKYVCIVEKPQSHQLYLAYSARRKSVRRRKS